MFPIVGASGTLRFVVPVARVNSPPRAVVVPSTTTRALTDAEESPVARTIPIV